jgi:ubiquinone/menaquinone biosynthesis C-methylase UbiE
MNSNREKMWSAPFRLGLYDLFLPVNFDRSIRAAFEALDLEPSAHLLDVGCGSGRILVHAAPWLRTGRYTGIDIAPGGLAYASRRARALGIEERVSLHQGDMRSLSTVVAGPFDAAVIHFAVYTLSSEADRRQVVTEVSKVIRSGGKLAFVVPSETYAAKALVDDAQREEAQRGDASPYARALRRHLIYPLLELATRKHVERRLDDGTFHRYTEPELRDHVEGSGFSLERVERIRGVESYRAIACREARS